MEKIKQIPKIEYVLEGGISPFATRVQTSTIEWAKERNLLNEPSLLKSYEIQKIGYLACRAQPYDKFSDIMLTSEYMLLLCMLDDYSEEVSNPDDFSDYSGKILNILRGTNAPIKEDDFLKGWEEWWGRVRVGTPKEWQIRIIDSISKCFEAIMWEINNRIHNIIPDVHEYVLNRQHSGSVFVCFDLVERGGMRYCPNKFRDEVFVDLVNSASKIANWTNDILSLEKELKNGETQNLVISVHRQNKTSISDSLEHVMQMLDVELFKYTKLKNRLLTTNSSYKETVEKYIIGSEYMLLLCMLDDYSEEVSNPDDFSDYSGKILNILRGTNAPIKEDDFLKGWEEWWGRVRVGTPKEWQIRIIDSISKCFEAIMWEINNRIHNIIPDVHEYVLNRQHSGSVFVCFDLVERGGMRYCPNKFRDEVFVDLVNSASKIANWTNDILSLEKELKNGETQNLVISVHRQNKTSISDSLEHVMQMLDVELFKYTKLKNRLLTTNSSYKETVEKYIIGMEAAVRGQYEWGLRTGRF